MTLEIMSIKKRYLKDQPQCIVTLTLPKRLALNVEKVYVAGEFNQWNTQATPMRKLKNGDFKVTLDLESGLEYQFRYILDDHQWQNDDQPDKWTPNHYSGDENSVIVL